MKDTSYMENSRRRKITSGPDEMTSLDKYLLEIISHPQNQRRDYKSELFVKDITEMITGI